MKIFLSTTSMKRYHIKDENNAKKKRKLKKDVELKTLTLKRLKV